MRHLMHIDSLRRVLVVGTSGSGKTAFASALAERLETSHIELDALYWGENWVPNPEADYIEALSSALESEMWVIDGNISPQNSAMLHRATSIVWLNYSFPVVFGRAVRRTFRRIRTGERLYAGNQESIRQVFDLGWIPWWVIRTYSRRRREYSLLFAKPEFSDIKMLEFKSPQEAEQLIERLPAA